MSVIFSSRNLLANTVYQSQKDFTGLGYLKFTASGIVNTGDEIHCFIKLNSGGKSRLLGVITASSAKTLEILIEYRESNNRIEILPSVNLISLQVEFLEQYSYSFSKKDNINIELTKMDKKLDDILYTLNKI